MAWNPSPRVADCRDIAEKWGMNQVVILGINTSNGKYEIASYGQTKALCDEAKHINDRINRIIQEQDYGAAPNKSNSLATTGDSDDERLPEKATSRGRSSVM